MLSHLQNLRMNGSVVATGMMATASIALLGFLMYRVSVLMTGEPDSPENQRHADNSSLEEDFKDISEFIPIREVRQIIEDYIRYDPQIGETVTFVNEQKRFILREFQRMPPLGRFVCFLEQNGLDVDRWKRMLDGYWKRAPRFVRQEPGIASGGFTVMINTVLQIIPRDELHELLKLKVKYSASFRRLLQALKSEEFSEFSKLIEESDVLQQHYFWAKESGLEITFCLELFRNLYVYLTEGLA